MRIQQPSEMLDLYDDVGRLCDAGKTSEAFTQVVDALGLSLSAKSRRVFDLILGKLGEVQRFKGNDHMAEHLRGSTAKHTLQVMVLVGKLMTDAFPDVFYAPGTVRKNYPGHKSQRPKGMNATRYRAQISDTLTDLAVQTLMHDFGEIFVELSTVSTRRKAGNNTELRDLERKFAEFSMRLAYHAVEEHPGYARQSKMFDDVIDNIRKDIGKLAEKPEDVEEDVVGQTVGEEIDRLIEPYKAKLNLAYIPQESLRELSYYLRSFDEPEGHSHFERFNGMVVKTCQNIHTVTQIVEHAGREGGAPYDLANSSEVKATLHYAERGLPAIWNEIEPGNQIQSRIANQCAKLAYGTNLGIVRLPMPLVIDFAAGLKEKFTASSANDNAAIASIDPKAAAKDGWTMLHMACLKGDEKAVAGLLERGVDVEARTKTAQWTPLHVAASHGRTKIVRMLLDYSADVNAKAEKGWTPLHLAAYTNRPATAHALMEAGANEALRTKSGRTPMDWAQGLAHDDVVNVLDNLPEGESAPDTPARLAEIRRAATEFCTPKSDLPSDIADLDFPVMQARRIDDFSGTKRSVYQLYALYAAALKEAETETNFTPPEIPKGKALFELKEVPPAIRQHMDEFAPKDSKLHPQELPKPKDSKKALYRHRYTA